LSSGNFFKKFGVRAKNFTPAENISGSYPGVRATSSFPDALTPILPPLIRKRRVGESGVLSGTAMLAQVTI